MRLSGKKVLLVGVSLGLGAATAHYLLKEGATVAIADREDSLLKKVGDLLSNNKKLFKIKMDVSKSEGTKKLIDQAVKAMGGLDHIAVMVGGFEADTIDTISALDLMVQNHIKIPLYVVNSAVPKLKQGSSIVLISSSMALKKATGPLSYTIGKVGTAKEVELLAKQLLERGIRVNGIAPLSIDGQFKPDTEFKNARKLGDNSAPPDAFAKVVVWLMTEESAWVNGTVIPVDGGATLKG